MKKTVTVLLLGAFVASISCMGLADTYAMPPLGPQWQYREDQWLNDHERQWQDHEFEWREHDHQWWEHRDDYDWKKEHAYKWKHWYLWHYENGDRGFTEFLPGIRQAIRDSM